MPSMDLPMEVRISFGHSNVDNAYIPTITITDRVSHTSLVEVALDEAQLTQLLAGAQVIAPGSLISAALYGRQVGKRMEILRVPPEDWPEHFDVRMNGIREKGTYTEKPTDEMRKWAQWHMEATGYQTWEWTRHNYGWSLLFRRWVATTEEERAERADPHFTGL